MARAFFEEDPEEAFAFLNAIPKENVRRFVRQFADMIPRYPATPLPRYPDEMAQWIETVDDVDGQELLTEDLAENVFERVSGKRLELLVEELPQGTLKNAFQPFVEAKRELLEGRGDALSEWFGSTSEAVHWNAIRSLYAEVKEHRPELLGELVRAASYSTRGEGIARQLQADFPKEAGSWLRGQVAVNMAGEWRQVEGVVSNWVSADTDAAVSWFRESAPDWIKTPKIHGRIAASWAQRDTSEAVAWASAVPDREQRLGALAGVADSWGDYDLPGVTAWAASLEDAGERDHVAKAFLPRRSNADPRSAAAWALSLGEVSDRVEHIQRLLERQSHRIEEIFAIVRDTEMNATEREAILGGLEQP